MKPRFWMVIVSFVVGIVLCLVVVVFEERQYFIFVGIDTEKPSYGHVINVTFYPDAESYDDVTRYIKMSKVTWSNDGVTFEEASGDQIFIPKSSFIDTR